MSFGRDIIALSTTDQAVALEAARGKAAAFAPLDDFIADLLRRSFAGEHPLTVANAVGRRPREVVARCSSEQSAFLNDHFGYENQRKRGAWYLPDEVKVDIGLVNTGAHMQQCPRSFWNVVLDQRFKVSLAKSPPAVLVWSVLEDLARRLLAPIYLRTSGLTELTSDEQKTSWSAAQDGLTRLGLEAREELEVMRYGAGWCRLDSAAQLTIKQRYVARVQQQLDPGMVTRYRAILSRQLVDRYYSKARKDGTVLRRIVITKAFEPVLSGLFAGSWLAFLEYIEEPPHPDEHVVDSIPTAALGVGHESPTANDGRAVVELAQLSESLVARRVALLRRYWSRFDELQARQNHGMAELWGLVPARMLLLQVGDGRPVVHDSFPQEFVVQVAELWGTMTVPRWPEYIVSELYPAARMAEALGPALRFWDKLGQACWRAAEGGYGNLEEMPQRLADEAQAMADLGCPVSDRIFDDLLAKERKLGPPQPITQGAPERQSVGLGITMTMTLTVGSWRRGYEHLRDELTDHRRRWAAAYLDSYLRARWTTELRAAAAEFSRHEADKGKPPTLKQFIGRPAASATMNNWFGGSIDALYDSIGKRSSIIQQPRQLLPPDRASFANRVIAALGGTPQIQLGKYGVAVDGDLVRRAQEIQELGRLSLHYVQQLELLGHAPTPDEFGSRKLDGPSSALSVSPGALWIQFSAAVERALRESGT